MVLKYDCIKNDQLNRTVFINAKYNANMFALFFCTVYTPRRVLSFTYFFHLLFFGMSLNDNLLCWIRLLH